MSYALAIIKFLKLKKTHKFIRHSLSAYYCRFQITATDIYTARHCRNWRNYRIIDDGLGYYCATTRYNLSTTWCFCQIFHRPNPPPPPICVQTHPLPANSFPNSPPPPRPFVPKLKSRAMAHFQNRHAPSSTPWHHPISCFAPLLASR
jgi:hypothetical protein